MPLSTRVMCAALISVALHLALLSSLRPGAASGRVQVWDAPLSVRIVPAPSAVVAETVVQPAARALADAGPRSVEAAAPQDEGSQARERVSVRTPTEPAQKLETVARRLMSERGAPADPPTPVPSVLAPGLAAAPAYLSGAHLDPGPHPLHDIEPVFPAEAGLQDGTVVLRVLINEAGIVDNVAVVRSSPPGLFENSALAAFGAATFSPGMVSGVAVKSQVTIEVQFTPFNRGAAVSGRSY